MNDAAATVAVCAYCWRSSEEMVIGGSRSTRHTIVADMASFAAYSGPALAIFVFFC